MNGMGGNGGGLVVDHQHHECNDCYVCRGGLALCTVCGAGEGQLLKHCPGYRLSEETLESCYSGNVLDLFGWRVQAARKGKR